MKTGSRRLIALMTGFIISSSALCGAADVYAGELSEEALFEGNVIEEYAIDDADAKGELSEPAEDITDLPEYEGSDAVEETIKEGQALLSDDVDTSSDEDTEYDGSSDENVMISVNTAIPETSGSVLRLYGAGIQKGQHIYFGRSNANTLSYKDPNGGNKPYWRVLDPAKDNTGASGMFLMSEDLWGNTNDPMNNGGVAFNTTNSDAWDGSKAKEWCNVLFRDYFTSEEQAGIKAVSKNEAEIPDPLDPDYAYGASSLKDDKVFFMSYKEITDHLGSDPFDYLANYLGSPYTPDGNSAKYWGRTPYVEYNSYYPDPDKYVYTAEALGFIQHAVTETHTARPAFNINRSAILFASEAMSGKRSDGVGSTALCSVDKRNVKDWRLTLIDSSRAFTATTSSDGKYVAPAGTVTIQYSGARTGANEYVSAILCDQSNNILYYGRIVNNSVSGTANITIPSGVTEGNTYKLKVFSEQFNGDLNDAVQQSTGRLSDLASNPKEFTIKIPYNINKAALSATFYQYDAKAHIPAVTFGGRTLAANTDYTYVIKNSKGGVASAPVTADTYTMTLTGKGQYYGSCTLSYKIMPYDINGAALSPASFRYDGKAHIPAVTFNGKTLAVNTDYTYVIKDSKGAVTGSPKNAGTYSMILTGKGGYYKTSTKNFTITRLPNTLNVKAKSKTFTVKRPKLQKKKQVLKAKYNFKKKGQGKIKYSLLSATRSGRKYPAYFKVNSKNGQITMKRTSQVLPGTYTVKVNVKAAGNTNYEPKTVVVTFKVKVKKK